MIGDAASSAGSLTAPSQFLRVLGETIELAQMPLQLVERAIQQAAQAQADVHEAVARVMINEGSRGHELWWNLTQGLKQPVLTLTPELLT